MKLSGLRKKIRIGSKPGLKKKGFFNKEINPFLKVFLLLTGTTLSILLTALGGSFAYEKVLKPEESLPPNTMIGTIEVGEMKISEAVDKVNQHIDEWRTMAIIDLYFFDEKVLIESENIIFDVENIVIQAKNDGFAFFTPAITLAAIEEATKKFSYSTVTNSVNLQSIKVEVEQQLKSLNIDTVTIDVNEHLDGNAKIETSLVAQANINAQDAKGYISNWVTALNGTTIKSNQVFSLLEALENKEQHLTKGDELNIIASGVYQVLMQTNFQLVERHIGRTTPSYAKVGYDAIAVPNSADLKFYNRNFYDYELRATYENNTLNISLHGKPFLYTYEIFSEEEEVVEPRTIVQFSTKRIIGDAQTIRNGQNGYLVSVYQTVWSKDGEFIQKIKLTEDFYPPIHRIEERSLYVEPIDEEEFEWFDPEIEFPESEVDLNSSSSSNYNNRSNSSSSSDSNSNLDTKPETVPEINTQYNNEEFSRPEPTVPFESEPQG